MLLNIYLVSTGACIAVDTISAVAIANKLQRDGYDFVKKEKSVAERLVNWIKVGAIFATPVVNVLLAMGFVVLTDSLYETLKDAFIKEGTIKRINDNTQTENNYASVEERLKAITEERDNLLRQQEILKDAINKANNIQNGIYSDESEFNHDDVFYHERHAR